MSQRSTSGNPPAPLHQNDSPAGGTHSRTPRWNAARVAPHPSPLRDFVEAVAREWRTTAAFAVLVLALAATYLALAPRSYQANIVLQVDEATPKGAAIDELLAGEKSAADVEMEVFGSRTLLGAVVDELQLTVKARPASPSVLAKLRGLLRHDPTTADPPPGASGERRLRIEHLALPDDLVDQPMKLTSLPGGRYELSTDGGEIVAEGRVGEAVERARGPGRVAITVAELVAPAGAVFDVVQHDRAAAIRDLERNLRIKEKRRRAGVFQADLERDDPQEVARVLNGIASIYLRRDQERRSADAEKTLQFVEAQMQALEPNLREAESALHAYQERKGSVDLSRDTEAMVNQLVDIEKEIASAEMEQMAMRHRFTEQHPSYAAATDRVASLRQRRAAVEARMRQVPKTEVDTARLTRNVKVQSALYNALLNKAEEVRILKAGIGGRIRVVDPAVPPRKPVSPNAIVVAMSAILLACVGGVGMAMARRSFRDVVDAPDDIEKYTGLPVYVAVPHSEDQEALDRDRRAKRAQVVRDGKVWTQRYGDTRLLASTAPDDLSIEALRNLRTSLKFAMAEARSNTVAIGSPSPGAGKSFVVANLSALIAETGRKVLVVDADLRRGGLHRIFGFQRSPGLTDVLIEATTLEGVVQATPVPGLALLSTGTVPPNPSELLATDRFEAVLATASQQYDLVIIDTAPTLAVTDSMLVAACAGVNLLVLRAGHQSMREILLTVDRFAQNGISLQGMILNDARAVLGNYGRYGKHYNYRSVT